jgi:polyhydroxyalkanoate synthesis regulator protein
MTDNYSENQEQLTDQFKKMFEGENSMEKWAEIGQQNMALFQKSMEAFSDGGTTAKKPEPKSEPPSRGSDKENEEIETLRRELAEMQSRLNGFSKDS